MNMDRLTDKIFRKVDDDGRVQIPKAIRDLTGIEHGEMVAVKVEGDRVIIETYKGGGRNVKASGM